MPRQRVNWNLKKSGIALLVVFTIGISSFQAAQASSLSGAKNKKTEAQSKLDSANSKIDSIKNQQSKLQSEINKTDQELVTLLVNIGILKDELKSKNEELDKVTQDLANAQAVEQSQYAAMKKRIQFMYERGDEGMLETILSSKDISDFLNRVDYVSDVYTYDRNLLTQYQDTVKQVAELKVTVENEKAEMEEMKTEYDAQQVTLNNILAEKKSKMSNYNTELASVKATAEAYKKTIEEQNRIIQQEQEKQKKAAEAAAKAAAAASKANSSSSSSSGSGSSSSSSSSASAPVSGSASSVVSYALQFVGNPYVWGGTSLTNGADCSGFVMSVYAKFGVSLPHSSAALQGVGTAVDYSSAQPGDLICYPGHVAIYMGNGQIVHAQSTATGITTSSATYRTIVAVRRVM